MGWVSDLFSKHHGGLEIRRKAAPPRAPRGCPQGRERAATPGMGRCSPARRETVSAASPVSIEGCFIIPGRVQRLLRVDGHGGPDALVGTLQRLVVGGEDVEGAGHAGGSEVGQVLAALLLLVQLALVAVAPRTPALRAAGAAGERRRDTTHRASLMLGRGTRITGR